jgi:ribosomal protein L7/L12
MIENIIRSFGATPEQVLAHLAKNAPEAFHRALIFCRNEARDKKSQDDSFILEIYHLTGKKIHAIRVCTRLRGLDLEKSRRYVEDLIGTEAPTAAEDHGA